MWAEATTPWDFPAVEGVTASVYEIPTDQPEADGTLAWSATTVVRRQVQPAAAGLGWTYAGRAPRPSSRLDPGGASGDDMRRAGPHEAMVRACRNLGRPGLVACAISAVDIALWDLKARLLGVSLADLFGRPVRRVPIYGSGGFTTYDDAPPGAQLEQWVGDWAIPRVKIKIGESWGDRRRARPRPDRAAPER